MNRSIFQMWQPNLNCLNVFFILFLYLFNVFCIPVLYCDDLMKIAYNGITVRYSPSICSFRLYNSIEFLQYRILNKPNLEYKFNIFKYLQLNGFRFPRNSVYDHYHLNLYLDNIYNVHYNFAFTHNPEKLNLLPHEYYKFSGHNLHYIHKYQYILTDLKIYDLNVLKAYDNTSQFKQFLFGYHEKCIFQFKNLF